MEGRVERIPALPGARSQPDTVLLEMSDPAGRAGRPRGRGAAPGGRGRLREPAGPAREPAPEPAGPGRRAAESRAPGGQAAGGGGRGARQGRAHPGARPRSSRAARRASSASRPRSRGSATRRASAPTQAQLAAQRARVEPDAGDATSCAGARSIRSRCGPASPACSRSCRWRWASGSPPGTTLARVARPENLKAELRIPEVQAKDVRSGMPASIDTRNGIVPGRVMRVAPSVAGGSGDRGRGPRRAAPQGARPEPLGGRHDRDRAAGQRPLRGPARPRPGRTARSSSSSWSRTATRRCACRWSSAAAPSTPWKSSSGLAVGDQVILSDTSAQDEHDRIRLE